MLLGIYDAALGKPAEEVKHMQEAVAIDPLSFYMARQYGTALLSAGRYGEALRELDYAREIHPASADLVDHWFSQIYQKRGMADEAVRYDVQELRDIDQETYNSPFVVHQDMPRSQLLDVYKREGWLAYWATRWKTLQHLRIRSACHG